MGGLKMLNVIKYLQSCKVSWIKRLLFYNGKWRQIMKICKYRICIVNYDTACLSKAVKTCTDIFWKEVFAYWQELHSTIQSVKPFSFKMLLNDLIDKQGVFYSFAELKRRFSVNTNFIEYYMVINAVERTLVKLATTSAMCKADAPVIASNIEIFLTNKKGYKKYYDILNANYDISTLQLKWCNVFINENLDWKCIYHMPFKQI